ncbi:hypothetical protein [Cohnella fermenti]|uniref:Uncharacterized protein n=1 Tax=Cohnella fermenti TaxID=2565925 RepID=A0A4S4C729_9BACL|nr:hypothetical protein [Cohnella fermenti]THF83747.1 hypothetical protein E6C55_03400 [Cohnella fermenti]
MNCIWKKAGMTILAMFILLGGIPGWFAPGGGHAYADGEGWIMVGSAGFSAGSVRYNSIVADHGTVYVAYRDIANSNKATVMRNDGTGWEPVGNAGFSANVASNTSAVRRQIARR